MPTAKSLTNCRRGQLKTPKHYRRQRGSMSKQGFVWIDVTDFLRWKGALTGFQHIQYNIAKQYIVAGRDVKFFVYDQALRAFAEVPFDPDEIAKNGINTDEQETVAAVSFKRRAIGALKRRTPS